MNKSPTFTHDGVQLVGVNDLARIMGVTHYTLRTKIQKHPAAQQSMVLLNGAELKQLREAGELPAHIFTGAVRLSCIAVDTLLPVIESLSTEAAAHYVKHRNWCLLHALAPEPVAMVHPSRRHPVKPVARTLRELRGSVATLTKRVAQLERVINKLEAV